MGQLLAAPFDNEVDTFNLDALIAGTEQTLFAYMRSSFDDKPRDLPKIDPSEDLKLKIKDTPKQDSSNDHSADVDVLVSDQCSYIEDTPKQD